MSNKTLYLVNNWCDCYNVYFTRERAEKALEILKRNCPVDFSCDSNGNGYWITEIKEGEGFGSEVRVDGQSDVFVD